MERLIHKFTTHHGAIYLGRHIHILTGVDERQRAVLGDVLRHADECQVRIVHGHSALIQSEDVAEYNFERVCNLRSIYGSLALGRSGETEKKKCIYPKISITTGKKTRMYIRSDG